MQSSYIDGHDLSKIMRYLSPKHRLVCNVAYWTGWRIDDILHLARDNIDVQNNTLTIVERKTKKTSTKKLMPWQTIELINHSNGKTLIFEGNKKDRPIARQTIWRAIKRACERAGIDENGVSAHSIRKLFAVNEYERTKSILDVQKALNHKYMTTTMLYCFSDKI